MEVLFKVIFGLLFIKNSILGPIGPSSGWESPAKWIYPQPLPYVLCDHGSGQLNPMLQCQNSSLIGPYLQSRLGPINPMQKSFSDWTILLPEPLFLASFTAAIEEVKLIILESINLYLLFKVNKCLWSS
jgi:hypothetical protein